jgi:SAM-dependent methyltransferase
MGEYFICPVCGSANYISEKNASDENNDYFNTVYAGTGFHEDDKRRRLFEECSILDSRLHSREVTQFSRLLYGISQLIMTSEKSAEIGFGQGDEIIRYLRDGVDIYGLDLSPEAVKKFVSRYPEYAERVVCAATLDFVVDVVYSNALFEHLDDADDFLANTSAMLRPGGHLCMRLPVITRNASGQPDTSTDINFWKPCHRVLYTLKGLKTILSRHGFVIKESASQSYYGYKVMSVMRRLGYSEIVYVRNPYMHFERMSDLTFKRILFQGFIERITCSDFGLIAIKTMQNDHL